MSDEPSSWRIAAISADDYDLKIGIEAIRRQLDWWLKFDEIAADRAGASATDDSHIIPPTWPSRGALKAWVAILQRVENEAAFTNQGG